MPAPTADELLDTIIVEEPESEASEEPLEVEEGSFATLAYPNMEYSPYISSEHDTAKWLDAVKVLYSKEKDGNNRSVALSQVTANWNETEKLDFRNWLRFYEEGNHLRYKYAQTMGYDGGPGYFFSYKQDPPVQEAAVSGQDINDIKTQVSNELTEKERKSIIEKQRRKIIGRLDSTEKLLRSEDGHLFAGKELESLMETIFNLKKKVSLLNKLSTSTKIYNDLIIREANVLVKNGYSDAAELLFALAQEAPPPDGGAIPAPTPPAPPAQGSGSAGAGVSPILPAQPNAPEAAQNAPPPAPATPPPLPATPLPLPGEVGALPALPPLPGATPVTPAPSAPASATPAGPVASFLQNLESGGVLTDPKQMKNKDKNSSDDLEVYDDLESDDQVEVDDLYVWAQAMPPVSNPPAPAPIAPPAAIPPAAMPSPVAESVAPVVEESLEVEEEQLPESKTTVVFDKQINDLFSSITINDVIIKLEDLAKIFKVREVPRQLALIDMMLDSLGLASYFPDLSEATNKALESNNYISTRIDNILSRLQGAVKTQEINLYGDDTKTVSPEIAKIQNQLQSNQAKEKLRKDLRKQQELEEAVSATKETPEVEIEGPGIPPAPVPAPAPVALPPSI